MTEDKIIFQTTTKTGKIVSFRYPTIDDAQILTNYINEISKEKTYIIFQGEQQTLEEETDWLKTKLEKINQNKCVFILAFIDNKLIGSSDITLKSLVQKHVGSFGITISKEFRNEGIGKILIDLVIKESVSKIIGLKIITLEVFSNNSIGQSLYRKMGFSEYGCLPNGIKYLDDFVDEILMYKKV